MFTEARYIALCRNSHQDYTASHLKRRANPPQSVQLSSGQQNAQHQGVEHQNPVQQNLSRTLSYTLQSTPLISLWRAFRWAIIRSQQNDRCKFSSLKGNSDSTPGLIPCCSGYAVAADAARFLARNRISFLPISLSISLSISSSASLPIRVYVSVLTSVPVSIVSRQLQQQQ